jgi:hypothetical protein
VTQPLSIDLEVHLRHLCALVIGTRRVVTSKCLLLFDPFPTGLTIVLTDTSKFTRCWWDSHRTYI